MELFGGTEYKQLQWIDGTPGRHDVSREAQASTVRAELAQRRALGEMDVCATQNAKESDDQAGAGATGHADAACVGDQNLERLYATLAEIDAADYPRSHHQRKFHDSFIKASLRSIYTDDYAVCEKRLQERFRTDYINPIVMIVTPRRFGKTYSVAQYVAAYTAAVHGKEVAIFSTGNKRRVLLLGSSIDFVGCPGRRASKKMLDLVMKFLKPLIAGKKRIYTRNVEEVIVEQLESPFARNKVCSYPAKVQVIPSNQYSYTGKHKILLYDLNGPSSDASVSWVFEHPNAVRLR
jgi:hypothetical protein